MGSLSTEFARNVDSRSHELSRTGVSLARMDLDNQQWATGRDSQSFRTMVILSRQFELKAFHAS